MHVSRQLPQRDRIDAHAQPRPGLVMVLGQHLGEGEDRAAQRLPVVGHEQLGLDQIAVEEGDDGGVRALHVLRRVAYEPALEAVVGNLLIPVGSGLIDITAFHHTQQTGYREQQLLTLAMQQSPSEGAQKLARRLGLKHYDDPAHDEKFPSHPLTCVRRALKWLLSLPQAELAVTQRPEPLPASSSEIELAGAACAIKAPPRYVQVPAGVLPVPAGVALLSRVVLEAADDPQMLDVRQIAGVSLAAEDRSGQLLKLIQRQVGEWQAQGAQQIEMSHEPFQLDAPPSPGVTASGERIGLAVQVKMVINGAPTQTVARWIADADGRVFRIGMATPPYVPVAEAAADVDLAVRAFRRLPAKSTGAWLTSDLKLAPAKRAAAAAAQPSS